MARSWTAFSRLAGLFLCLALVGQFLRAMQKARLRGRTDIVRYAVAQGWLQERKS